jgi:hypothetical protein
MKKTSLLSRGSVALSVLGKSKTIPWATPGLPSTQPLSEKLHDKMLPEQERRAGWPGWFVFITLRGKRLGSEVPADPLISIGGRSHDQRQALQLPLQHGDRAA